MYADIHSRTDNDARRGKIKPGWTQTFKTVSMCLIPGVLMSIITFPGVIVHEMAHLLFCRLYGVAVLKVCYFRLGNPAGYVIHETPTRPARQIMIGVGPFFLNTLLGLLVALPVSLPGMKEGLSPRWHAVLLWLGISIAMHAFPSTGDAKSIWRAAWGPGAPLLLRLLSIPLVALLYLFALGSVFWLHVAYGAIVTLLLPHMLVEWWW